MIFMKFRLDFKFDYLINGQIDRRPIKSPNNVQISGSSLIYMQSIKIN